MVKNFITEIHGKVLNKKEGFKNILICYCGCKNFIHWRKNFRSHISDENTWACEGCGQLVRITNIFPIDSNEFINTCEILDKKLTKEQLKRQIKIVNRREP